MFIAVETPGIDYWKELAETRRQALESALQENEKVKYLTVLIFVSFREGSCRTKPHISDADTAIITAPLFDYA
mgnify:FL=1